MPRPATRTTSRAREDGFSLLEMIIAMLIMAILIIAALKAFGGAKKSTYLNEGKTVGSAYMQALSQYHADFANRHPRNWGGNNTAATQRGPLNLTNRPYLKSTPEAVTDGRVGVSVGANCGGLAAPAGATTQSSWVSICLGQEPQAAIRVVARRDPGAQWTTAAGASICWMGSTTATPKC